GRQWQHLGRQRRNECCECVHIWRNGAERFAVLRRGSGHSCECRGHAEVERIGMRATNQNPRARRDQITVQAVGDETLLYGERRHMAFCLNAIASAMWRLADGARTIAEIEAAAGRELGAEIGDEIVRVAYDDLRDNGLMIRDEEADSCDAGDPATRVLSRR